MFRATAAEPRAQRAHSQEQNRKQPYHHASSWKPGDEFLYLAFLMQTDHFWVTDVGFILSILPLQILSQRWLLAVVPKALNQNEL